MTTQYQDTFYTVVNNILNEGENKFTSSNIRFAYQEMGSPFFARGETYIYMDINEVDFYSNRHIDSFYNKVNGDLVETRTSMKRIICRFILYGDDSLKIGNKIRMGLFSDEAKRAFRKESLFLIPDIPSPFLSKELINNTWFKRVDFDVNFNGITDPYVENHGGVDINTININILEE